MIPVYSSKKVTWINVGVWERPTIDILARVVCRREIDEARSRVIIERKKYYYQPSLNWVRERLRFKPKFKK